MTSDQASQRDRADDRVDDIQRQLLEEFNGKVAPEVVQKSLSESLDTYAAVRIRDFVPLFVYRDTRERLKQNPATQ